MKTIKSHLFENLSKEKYEMAIVNCLKQNMGYKLNSYKSDFVSSLCACFYWGDTPEGFDFWLKTAKQTK